MTSWQPLKVGGGKCHEVVLAIVHTLTTSEEILTCTSDRTKTASLK